MHLKKETRILIIDKLDDFVIGLIIRGIAGIENSIVFKDCNELYNFLNRGIGIAGEINYIMINNDTCTKLKLNPKIKIIDINSIKDEELLTEIKEVLKTLQTLSLKYIIYKTSQL